MSRSDFKIPIVWEDRYGGQWPHPSIVCEGRCEGLGFYPIQGLEKTSWDRWTFVKCEQCNGTGRKPFKAKEI